MDERIKIWNEYYDIQELIEESEAEESRLCKKSHTLADEFDHCLKFSYPGHTRISVTPELFEEPATKKMYEQYRNERDNNSQALSRQREYTCELFDRASEMRKKIQNLDDASEPIICPEGAPKSWGYVVASGNGMFAFISSLISFVLIIVLSAIIGIRELPFLLFVISYAIVLFLLITKINVFSKTAMAFLNYYLVFDSLGLFYYFSKSIIPAIKESEIYRTIAIVSALALLMTVYIHLKRYVALHNGVILLKSLKKAYGNDSIDVDEGTVMAAVDDYLGTQWYSTNHNITVMTEKSIQDNVEALYKNAGQDILSLVSLLCQARMISDSDNAINLEAFRHCQKTLSSNSLFYYNRMFFSIFKLIERTHCDENHVSEFLFVKYLWLNADSLQPNVSTEENIQIILNQILSNESLYIGQIRKLKKYSIKLVEAEKELQIH